MKVGCYIRVSTEDQIDNYSIEAQMERLANYCKAKDWTISNYYTDPGYSGSNMNRPALNLLIEEIRKKNIDLVLVYKLDRLSRSQRDTLYLIEEIFLKNKVEFVSLSENFDTSTPFGRAMVGILSVFAQLEREQIKERLTMGRTARAKEGLFHGGAYAPVGYDYSDGELVVNDYEAMQVRELFDLYLRGYSIGYIQKYLNQSYSNKYSSWNSSRAVSNCLKNTVYIGKIKFNGNEYIGSHPPIIDNKLFQDANLLYQKRLTLITESHSKKAPFKAASLLSGLLYCQHCKAKYHSNHGYYKCYSRAKSSKKFIIDPNCKNKNWDIEQLDQIIKQEVSKLTFDTTYIKQEDRIDLEAKEKGLLLQQSKIEIQLEKLIQLYEHTELSYHLVSEKIKELQSKKDLLLFKLNRLKKSTTIERMNTASLLDTLDLSQQRYLLQSLIDTISLDENHITIYWKFNQPRISSFSQ